MTREEILEKSRNDNASGDEREKEIHREASSYSHIIGLLLCILVRIVNRHYDGPISVDTAAALIWIGMYAVNSASLGKKLNSRFHKVAAVILTLFTLFTFGVFVYTLKQGI